MRARQIFNTARFGVQHLFGAYPAVTALVIFGLAVAAFALAISSVREAVRQSESAQQINASRARAGAEAREAAGAKQEAEDASIDRRVNDRLREQTIEPLIERAARAAHDSRERTRLAEADYDKAKKNSPRIDLDDRLLRERNCADLAELYPGERFPGCAR